MAKRSYWGTRLLLGTAVVAVVVLPPSSARASCVAPTVKVSPASGAPGTSIRVTGSYWASDCADTGGPPAPPDTVHVYFVQDGSRQLLGSDLAAGMSYELSMTTTIPTAAHPGRAQLEAVGEKAGTERTTFRVTGAAAPGNTLPFTGSGSVWGQALIALVAIGAGLALTRLGRRTRWRSRAL